MSEHAYLKNEFTEDKKCHNLINWLNLCQIQTDMMKEIEGTYNGLLLAAECDLYKFSP